MDKDTAIGKFELDDDMLAAFRQDGVARLRIYIPPNRAVVLGRGSKVDLEINVTNCQEDDIPLLRRLGGGCSVFLDEGNVIVSLVAPARGFGRINHYFRLISSWLIKGLDQIGIPDIKQAGVSDLVLGEKKIGGACLYREQELVFYSTTLLVSPQIELMERYLLHPPREPEYRKRRCHRDFVGSLETPSISSALDLAQELRSVLTTPVLD